MRGRHPAARACARCRTTASPAARDTRCALYGMFLVWPVVNLPVARTAFFQLPPAFLQRCAA